MNKTVWALIVAIGGLSQSVSSAAASDCGVPADVVAGNRISDDTFRNFVRRGDLVGTPPIAKPAGYEPASKYGAVGNGQHDDTLAIQNALNNGRRVWLDPDRTYLITKRLELRDGMELASNGTSTLLLARGEAGFSNTKTKRIEGQIYSPTGTGLLIQGSKASIRDIYIVKQYEDGKYVIGIEMRDAKDVSLQRLRFRGFSIAPGIITIRNSRNIKVASSIIHASCSQWPDGPSQESGDVGSFQITGITVDDDIPGSSERVSIVNNVIVDLLLRPPVSSPAASRGDQTDGINFAGKQKSSGSHVEFNYVNHVAEALDIFGKDIVVRHNTLGARVLGIKLIHQARDIRIESNTIFGKLGYAGIKIYNVQPGQPPIVVENIQVVGNRIDVTSAENITAGYAALDVQSGVGQPNNVTFRSNRISVTKCEQQALICGPNQCHPRDTTKMDKSVIDCE